MTELDDIYHFLAIGPDLTTSGQPTEDQLRALAEAGYGVIINLALHDDPRYSLADESGTVQGLGMTYVHIPVQFDNPTETDLQAFFNAMDNSGNRKRHLHCAANMRVTAFLGLYRAIREKKIRDEAFAPMHSIWEPDEVWSAFIADMLKKHTD